MTMFFNINWWWFFALGIIFLYMAWHFVAQAGMNLMKKDDSYRFATYQLFDKWTIGAVIALLVARIGFLLQHFYEIGKTGFFLLPYVKIHEHVYWLTAYPWRVFRFNEGIDYILFVVTWLITLVIMFKPMANSIIKLQTSNEQLRHSLLSKWFFGVIFLLVASIFMTISIYLLTR